MSPKPGAISSDIIQNKMEPTLNPYSSISSSSVLDLKAQLSCVSLSSSSTASHKLIWLCQAEKRNLTLPRHQALDISKVFPLVEQKPFLLNPRPSGTRVIEESRDVRSEIIESLRTRVKSVGEDERRELGRHSRERVKCIMTSGSSTLIHTTHMSTVLMLSWHAGYRKGKTKLNDQQADNLLIDFDAQPSASSSSSAESSPEPVRHSLI